MEALFKQYLCHGTQKRRIIRPCCCTLCASGAGIVAKDVIRFTAGGRARALLRRIRHAVAGAGWLVATIGRTDLHAVSLAGAGTGGLSTAAALCRSFRLYLLSLTLYRAVGPS